ncbi:MAG: hypothetical protein R3346_00990 [Candidatus Spechtbacterales bacterium]|nr:hypothetical protein [Candidatus Spechtbacterales bacterium]
MKFKLKQFTPIVILVLLISILGFITPTRAAEPINLNIDNYPKIPVPEAWGEEYGYEECSDGVCVWYFDLNCLEIGACDLSPGLILAFLYYGSLWLSGTLIFISLLYAGVLYILSGQKPGNRAVAQERLNSVILGAMILFFAVLVFTVINPDIINLQITGQYTVTNPGSEPRIASEDGETTTGFETTNTGKFTCGWDDTFETYPETGTFGCVWIGGEEVNTGTFGCSWDSTRAEGERCYADPDKNNCTADGNPVEAFCNSKTGSVSCNRSSALTCVATSSSARCVVDETAINCTSVASPSETLCGGKTSQISCERSPLSCILNESVTRPCSVAENNCADGYSPSELTCTSTRTKIACERTVGGGYDCE